MMRMRMRMMRITLLLVLALTGVCNGILPEIVNSGVSHILEDHTQHSRDYVEVKPQLPRGPRLLPQDPQLLPQDPQDPQLLPQDPQDPQLLPQDPEDASNQESNNISSSSSSSSSSEVGNSIDHRCVDDDDCGKTRYCVKAPLSSRCTPCKATDVSCTKDGECCGEQLCVWGQCSENATRGEAGSTCQYQSDCRPELCCALHKALLFSVCSAKPIERERCFGASNHLMELLSWDSEDNGARKHCPCAGELRCQHLGRGSMCLKREDSSEEDLSDSLYSEIDYII